MTVLWIVLAAVAVLALLALFLLWPGRPSAEKTAPFYGRNYAHRGLHSRDKSVPENSLTAFWISCCPKTARGWSFTTTRWTGSAAYTGGWTRSRWRSCAACAFAAPTSASPC